MYTIEQLAPKPPIFLGTGLKSRLAPKQRVYFTRFFTHRWPTANDGSHTAIGVDINGLLVPSPRLWSVFRGQRVFGPLTVMDTVENSARGVVAISSFTGAAVRWLSHDAGYARNRSRDPAASPATDPGKRESRQCCRFASRRFASGDASHLPNVAASHHCGCAANRLGGAP
jgi:hypothetical protein